MAKLTIGGARNDGAELAADAMSLLVREVVERVGGETFRAMEAEADAIYASAFKLWPRKSGKSARSIFRRTTADLNSGVIVSEVGVGEDYAYKIRYADVVGDEQRAHQIAHGAKAIERQKRAFARIKNRTPEQVAVWGADGSKGPWQQLIRKPMLAAVTVIATKLNEQMQGVLDGADKAVG